MSKGYDADRKTKDRAAAKYVIGATTFRAVRITPRVDRETEPLSLRAGQIANELAAEVKKEENSDAEARLRLDREFMELAAKQLTVLLVDEHDEHPTTDFLDEHLETVDVLPMLDAIRGGGESTDPTPGSGETPTSATTA